MNGWSVTDAECRATTACEDEIITEMGVEKTKLLVISAEE